MPAHTGLSGNKPLSSIRGVDHIASDADIDLTSLLVRLSVTGAKMRIFPLASIVCGVLWPFHFALAQPAPPPPPGFPEYVRLLDEFYNKRDISAYGNLFREDVKVFVDGSLVASGKISYLKRIQAEFRRNLTVSTLSWAQGSEILAMQSVHGCVPVWPDPHTNYHGCQWALAVRYDLADDHKIASVHILEAEGAWNIHPRPN